MVGLKHKTALLLEIPPWKVLPTPIIVVEGGADADGGRGIGSGKEVSLSFLIGTERHSNQPALLLHGTGHAGTATN